MTKSPPPYAALVDLPACGYRVYQLEHQPPPATAVPALEPAWQVSLKHFGIDSIAHNPGVLAAPIGLVVIDDKSDTWAHGIDSFRTELGRPEFLSAEVAESGPLVRVTRQHLRWQQSRITVDITETLGSPILELHFVIDWSEHQQILKLEIPTNLTNPRSFAKVAGAVTDLPPTGNEEPGQDWIAVEGTAAGQTHTVALLNAQTYSYDCASSNGQDGLLRTILIRSAPYAQHAPNPVDDNGIYAWEDQGRQERRFWLYAADGPVLAQNLDRLAEELQTPVEYVLASRHPGTLPLEQSFLEIEPSTIQVLAIKRSEDGNDLILRLQNRSPQPTTATVTSGPLRLNQSVALKPWQIKTLPRSPPTHTLHEVNALEL